MMSARSSLDPWKRSTRRTGHHLRNSLHQLASCVVCVFGGGWGWMGRGYEYSTQSMLDVREAHAGMQARTVDLGTRMRWGPLTLRNS